MADRTPQGKRRSPSRFAANYFNAEQLRKREGADERLQDFAARRPWLLKHQQSSPSSAEPASQAPGESNPDTTLGQLYERIKATNKDAQDPPGVGGERGLPG